MSRPSVSFRALGVPQPKGSTRAFMRPGMRFPVVTADNPKAKPWASTVRLMAQQSAPAGGPWSGAVALKVEFRLPRPKSLPKRIQQHVRKPDLDKLLRTVKDALKGVVYQDDSQVIDVTMRKIYHDAPGVMVEAWQVEPS